jgi:2-polyprenyl-3-methyl-5-hydroxy-6-metoxy-1,4-benzoquinol methylase
MLASCSLHVDHCPLCGQDHSLSAPFNRRTDCGIEWRYHICRNCSLVYQSPQMTEAEAADFYGSDYWKLWGQVNAPDEEQTKLQQARAEHLLGLIPPELIVNRLLDIGCAAGFVLREAHRKFSAIAIGVEPSESFRAFCASDGFQVYRSTDDLLGAKEAPFDCITMSHVLEHLRDPVGTLRTLRHELLTDQGVMAIEVPNLYAHRAFEAGHPTCFSPDTLRATLAAGGFATRELIVHNHPRIEIDRPLYISALAVPADVQVRFDRPNVWFERVKRAYTAKRGAWFRRAWKGTHIGVSSLFVDDLTF